MFNRKEIHFQNGKKKHTLAISSFTGRYLGSDVDTNVSVETKVKRGNQFTPTTIETNTDVSHITTLHLKSDDGQVESIQLEGKGFRYPPETLLTAVYINNPAKKYGTPFQLINHAEGSKESVLTGDLNKNIGLENWLKKALYGLGYVVALVAGIGGAFFGGSQFGWVGGILGFILGVFIAAPFILPYQLWQDKLLSFCRKEVDQYVDELLSQVQETRGTSEVW